MKIALIPEPGAAGKPRSLSATGRRTRRKTSVREALRGKTGAVLVAIVFAVAGAGTPIAVHAAHSGPPAPVVAVPGCVPAGPVQQWIAQADQLLEANGTPASALNACDQWIIIQHESGGDPSQVDTWDSNARAGHPSKGLMQCIDSTFNSYKLPGHDNIYNPVDNIIAGTRYAIGRYGSLANVPGVAAVKMGRPYVGY